MTSPTRLLVATRNYKKLDEFRHMLAGLPVEWVSLPDVGLGEMDVEETGDSFEENARLKAYAYQQASGLISLADDSGLVVGALKGAPGIYSARYGGPDYKTDQDRYQLLLRQLQHVPDSERSAYFVSVIAIALPGQTMDEITVIRGTLTGSIAHAPRGHYGFGYDPVFLLPDGRTLAEAPPAEKNEISHRANALRAALPVIQKILAEKKY
jgi:XTP/dITP diphosphohydrolase